MMRLSLSLQETCSLRMYLVAKTLPCSTENLWFESCKTTCMYSLVVAPQPRVRMMAVHLRSGKVILSKISSSQTKQPDRPTRPIAANAPSLKIHFKFTAVYPFKDGLLKISRQVYQFSK